jgi:thiol:disulfide interchange protein DsbC
MSPRRHLTTVLALAIAAAPCTAGAQTPDVEKIRAIVQGIVPHATIQSIRPTPMPGVAEVVADGTILYASLDGRFLLSGELLDTQERKSLTEITRADHRRAAIAGIDRTTTIRFAPKGEALHEVFVFTDATCGYCRRLHQHLPDYLEAGIAITYLAWPRGGSGTEPHAIATSVWCADDRLGAMTAAKFEQPLASRECDHSPVDAHRTL